MRFFSFIIWCAVSLHSLSLFGQLKDQDVYLLGNLCEVVDIHPLITSLKTEIALRHNPSTLLINGDITDRPITTKIGKEQLGRLFLLLDTFRQQEHVNILILPGDRDWNDNREEGYDAVISLEKEMEEYFEKHKIENAEYVLDRACPGPEEIKINDFITVIALNSQWWNHRYKKPQPSDAECDFITDADIAEEIDDIIGDNVNTNILIAAHHPIRSLGNYGGRYSLTDNLTPFPIIASFLNAYRSNVGGIYDISNPRLSRYSYLLYNELYFKSNIIMASAHEKNHQIHREIENIIINSGAPVKGTYAPSDYSSIMTSDEAGYIRLQYSVTGRVSSVFVPLNTEKETKHFLLFKSACSPGSEVEEVDENMAYIPCIMGMEEASEEITSDSVLVLPGEGYESGWFKKLFFGEHHRPTWTTPVKIPYLKISQDYKNLNPYGKGGGRQTLSLKFVNENGTRYTFRSVDKEPRKALNYQLRQSIIGRIFEDQTSAQHPFGAIPVAYMLDYLDILHAKPTLYVMPDSEALGPFRETYGGMLGMLEENPGKEDENGNHFGGAHDILKINELFRELYENKEHGIQLNEFIRARLFDILVGDWSKHEDNWKWAEYKKGDRKLFRPIPRDRDHVFSKWDGLLPWLADREWALPNTEGFDEEIQGFKSLVYQARYLDRFLATEADLDTYLNEARFIQHQLTDERLESALRKMPKESFAVEGDEILNKLIKRRNDLQKYALEYYKWLNEEVEVLGSAKDDFIEIYNKDGHLMVEIWDENDGQKGEKRLFKRSFDPAYTDLVKVYGLGEEDIYHVNIEKAVDIELVLLGGTQKDKYLLNKYVGNIKIVDDTEEVEGLKSEVIKLEDNWERKRYIYNRNGLKFDNYLPILTLGFNNYNGFIVQFTNRWTKQRWDKPDYHQKHKLELNLTTKGDYGAIYSGSIRHTWRKWDYIWKLTFANPNFFDSYYGQGNFTQIDPVLDALDYYVTTFNTYGFLNGARRQFWQECRLDLNTGFEYYVNKELENTILYTEENLLGVHERLAILPVKVDFDLDFRDNGNFSMAGNRFLVTVYNGWIVNREFKQFATVGLRYEQYFSTHNYRPVTLGIRIGGTKGFAEVPFYLQPRLGGSSSLRGYTSNRFFGRSMVHGGSELRWRIVKDDDATIPYQFGLTLFYDVGKVSNTTVDPDREIKFHQGYGAGFFLVPFDESFAVSFYLSFSEENSFYPQFTIGSSLN